MDIPAQLLLSYPFLLPLAAAFIVGNSGVLLRRASEVLGRFLWFISWAFTFLSVLGYLWAFYWAWSSVELLDSGSRAVWSVLSWILLLLGLLLVFIGLATLGRRAILPLPTDRLETRRIYSIIRRPMGLGWMIAMLGATLQSEGLPPWICYFGWLLLVNISFELEEWELKARIPAAREYLQNTPRYFPLGTLRQLRIGGK